QRLAEHRTDARDRDRAEAPVRGLARRSRDRKLNVSRRAYSNSKNSSSRALLRNCQSSSGWPPTSITIWPSSLRRGIASRNGGWGPAADSRLAVIPVLSGDNPKRTTTISLRPTKSRVRATQKVSWLGSPRNSKVTAFDPKALRLLRSS